jgi:hypothetical protein
MSKKFKGKKRRIKHLEQAPQMKKRIAYFIAMYKLSCEEFHEDQLMKMLIVGNRGLISESEDSLIDKFEEVYNQIFADPEGLKVQWSAASTAAFEGLNKKKNKEKWSYSRDDQAARDIIVEEAREIMTELFEEIVFG